MTSPLLLELGLSLAEARTGDCARAAARLEQAIVRYEASGAPAVPLALLNIERARVALLAGDDAGFTRHSACAARWVEGKGQPGLVARLQQLADEARQANRPVGAELMRGCEFVTSMTSLETTYATGDRLAWLAGEPNPARRARIGLQLLIECAQALGGCLFDATGDDLRLLAEQDMPAIDRAFIENAVAFLARAHRDDSEQTQIGGAVSGTLTQSTNMLEHRGERFQAFLLHTPSDKIGLLLLRVPEPAPLRVHADLLRAVGEAVARA